ncbi:MAG: ComEC/Rec2 family competence protein [Crocinitomicaceae bacterium]|nr:ComEC/Rec2 family competence protein [Crocinitomicaceae bacterium]
MIWSLAFLSGLFYAEIRSALDQEKNQNESIYLENSKIEIVSSKQSGRFHTYTAKLITPKNYIQNTIQLSMSGDCTKLPTGTLVELTHLNLQKIHASHFPWKLDFNGYLLQQGISFKGWIDSNQIQIVGSHSSISSQLDRLKESIQKILKENTSNHGLIMAICLGDKTDLHPDSKNLFIENGVAHIMAVSGLHIGIVYLLILSGLKWFKLEKKLIGILLAFLLIWFFIFLTGAAVSAVRAGIMISIYSIFLLLGRKSEKLHILIFTALIILLIDPSQIGSVGFQLSFGALIGILYFGEFLVEKLKSKYIVVNYFSGIIAVSLAVQITTLPLTIYYFHSFPLHFLVTNLIAIPFAFMVVVLFLMGLLIGWIPVLQEFIFRILDVLIDWVTYSLDSFYQFDAFFWKGLYLSPITLLFYYLGLLLFFGWMLKINAWKKGIVLVGTCSLIQCLFMLEEDQRNAVYLYDEKGICLLIKQGNQSLLLSNSRNVNTKYSHPIVKNRLQNIQLNGQEIIEFEGHRIVLNPDPNQHENLKADVIVFSDYQKAKSHLPNANQKVYATKAVWRKLSRKEFILIEDVIEL